VASTVVCLLDRVTLSGRSGDNVAVNTDRYRVRGMDRTRLAPLVGIVGCLLYAGLLVVPYVVVPASSGTAVGLYYDSGGINPVVGGFFALIAVIVMAAGRERRTDPGFAAGVALVLGLFMTGIALLWAITVPAGVVPGVGVQAPTYLSVHRWVVSGVGAVVPVAGGWWASRLGLL
jgi:hypothetical protein